MLARVRVCVRARVLRDHLVAWRGRRPGIDRCRPRRLGARRRRRRRPSRFNVAGAGGGTALPGPGPAGDTGGARTAVARVPRVQRREKGGGSFRIVDLGKMSAK